MHGQINKKIRIIRFSTFQLLFSTAKEEEGEREDELNSLMKKVHLNDRAKRSFVKVSSYKIY
jgi:hypothetical protein